MMHERQRPEQRRTMLPPDSREEPERREVSRAVARTVMEFRRFVDAHREEVEQARLQGCLEDFLYERFYSEDDTALPYHDTDPSLPMNREKYNVAARQLWNQYRALEEKYRTLKPGMLTMSEKQYKNGDGWIYAKVRGGIQAGQEQFGRFYLNIEPEQLPRFYYYAVPEFEKAGIRVDAKVPASVANAGDLNRLDQMVVYVPEADSAKALEILAALYKKNEAVFRHGTPRFSAELVDSSGFVMNGVSFGEEPSTKGESFGTLRARLLAELYADAAQRGYGLRDPRFADNYFRRCEELDIDPSNAAFNFSSRGKAFAAVRQRENQL